ncbi:hypothetical protein N3K66_001230 [Trichothecium roseum]|uniref:Uncharacterized protein n=1 Tax=Trichothecium roseum TaxID=47278 RepID=A0ACC0VFN7_9HYPO|nr:hypothetical protein N3K66_001230 [Trichothecium roseum]
MATDKMDRGLDEIIADTRGNSSRGRRNGGPRRGGPGPRRDRHEGPRDGIRKSYRDEPRDLDSDWVHDRYDDNNSRRAPAPRRRRDSPADFEPKGTKIRIANIHYDLTEEDLDELFTRIGPITKLALRYDRAGRSEGVAFVTYESDRDAREAIKQFDGANANGQPIRLTLAGPARNPFDSAVMPGRPLSERISAPGDKARSHSPERRYTRDDAARKGIDRYIPGGDTGSRSPPRRRGEGRGGRGRRPGARREGNDREGGRGEPRGNPRSKKTQEELDAEMADYFGGNGQESTAPEAAAQPASNVAATEATAAQVADIDMIE